LSASADRDDVNACREAGMNDFLAKPITAERLVAALRRR
jgi:CheY-like chemotaxis protein